MNDIFQQLGDYDGEDDYGDYGEEDDAKQVQ